MTTDLDRLIEAVEAGEGNRNDGTLYRLFGDSWVHAWDVIDRDSLNAAVSLLEALLPGWGWGRMSDHITTRETVRRLRLMRNARALLLATLRAYREVMSAGRG